MFRKLNFPIRIYILQWPQVDQACHTIAAEDTNIEDHRDFTKMTSVTGNEVFVTDLDFCPRCGTVLPLPESENHVACKLCNFKIDVRAFDGIEIKTRANFNRPEVLLRKNEDADTELKGPTVDRKCAKCGNDEMIYTTRQTRSADEGQTVFFTCPQCRFQEIEYS